MMFEEHCRQSKEQLGGRFEKVHRWLDCWAPLVGWTHRRMNHHKEGVETVRDLWGDEAAKAAELHIMTDLQLGKAEDIPTAKGWDGADSYLAEWR